MNRINFGPAALCWAIAAMVAPADSGAVQLFVNLNMEDRSQLEVHLDARDVPSNAVIRDVAFNVLFTNSTGASVTRSYDFYDQDLSTGLYRNLIPHEQEDVRRLQGDSFVYLIATLGGKQDGALPEVVEQRRIRVSGSPPPQGNPINLGVSPRQLSIVAFIPATITNQIRIVEPSFAVDWCLHWGADCGRAAADNYCRLRGYRRAESFQQAPDIGATTPTLVLGDTRVCAEEFCDGFAFINCVR